MIGVIAYPLGLAVWFSLTDAQVGESGHFIGLGNYDYLVHQGTYEDALRNTAVYTSLSTAIKAGLGLLMALALARTFPGRRVVYALLFLPFVFPVVIGTVAWYYLFSNVHGGINYLLLQAHLVPESIAWLGLGPLPMASSITVNVWHGTALVGVLLLAALRSVPADVLDAAVIDGARPVRRFMEVVLPYLSSALALGTVLSVVGTFGDFAIVHLLTGGGPANETTIVSTMAFQIALRDGALGVGTAAALSMVPVYLVVLVFVVRVAGNVAGAEETASLEFGTLVLGAKVPVVLGHSGCGAVKAALEGGDAPGQISTLYRLIGPGIDRQNKNLDVAIASNVRAQAGVLRKGSTVIAGLIRDGKLKLAGGVYDLTSGKVTMVEV